MATQYTPEEIAEIFEAYNNAIKTNTPISAELAKQMQDATKGFKGATDELNKFAKSIGTSAAQFTKSMYEGKRGMNAMGGAVDGVGTALEFLIGLIPGARLLKIGLTLLTKATVGATKVLSEQSDKLFKTYQDLSKVGAAAAGGMTDIFNSMQKFGYGIEELDKMTALIKENAAALSSFGGTVADGAKQFANAAGEIQRSDVGKSLQMLGKTPDEINRGVALFIKQQQQSGVSSANINKNLAEQSAAYIKNLDLLSRLTGKDADSLQAKLDDAMAEDAFNQTIYELRKKGEHDRANELEKAAKMLTGEAQKEFIRGAGGDISAMTKTMMVSAKAVGMVGDASFKAADYIDAVNQGGTEFRDVMGGLYKLNALNDVAFSAKELSDRQSRYADQTAKQQEEMAKAQQDLNQKGLDPTTKAAVEMRISQMQARDSLQSFVQLGVEPATKALATLARGGAGGAGMLPGGGGKAPMGGSGAGQMDYGKELYGKGGAKGYLEKMVQAESGGRNIANQSGAGGVATSSAFGLAQITKGTFEGLVSKAGQNNPLYGKTFDDMKSDTKLQMEAARQLTDQNRQFLESRKLPTSDAALYLAHFLGPGGAARALSQSDNSPLSSAVDPNQLAANPMLQKMSTVADLKNWADQKMGGGGFRDGGIASGPTSGYSTTLHGTEAVVPLPNGKTIPVEMAGFSGNFADQTSLMSQQLDKLDELVRVMQNQVSVSTKILQAAN